MVLLKGEGMSRAQIGYGPMSNGRYKNAGEGKSDVHAILMRGGVAFLRRKRERPNEKKTEFPRTYVPHVSCSRYVQVVQPRTGGRRRLKILLISPPSAHQCSSKEIIVKTVRRVHCWRVPLSRVESQVKCSPRYNPGVTSRVELFHGVVDTGDLLVAYRGTAKEQNFSAAQPFWAC